MIRCYCNVRILRDNIEKPLKDLIKVSHCLDLPLAKTVKLVLIKEFRSIFIPY